MNIREVTEHIIYSFSNVSYGSSLPRILNLLGVNKKQKAEMIEKAFFDYVKGKDSVVLISISTSSKLFQYILRHVPHIWFIEGRVLNQNKRKDVLALFFTHQNLII